MPIVVARLRPSTVPEEPLGVYATGTSTLTALSAKSQKDFSFDMVLPETQNQTELFSSISKSFMECVRSNLVSSLYERDHVVVAFGPAGSGKTFTLFGRQREEGVLIRLQQRLKEEGYKTKMRAFEVGNEQMYDLLEKYPDGNKNISIKEDTEKGICLDGLREVKIPGDMNTPNLLGSILNYTYSTGSTHDRKPQKVISLSIRNPSIHPTREIRIHFLEIPTPDSAIKTRRETNSNNKHLNILDSVVSSLLSQVSGKGRTHDPIRDSKIFIFLKHMMANPKSIKWIFATVATEKSKVTDALDSLGLAKKLMSFSDQIQPQEVQGSQSIRTEVKMMRQELENSRFLKAKRIQTEWDQESISFETPESVQGSNPRFFKSPPRSRRQLSQQQPQTMQMLAINEQHFREIIKMYEERITHLEGKVSKKEAIKGLFNEKKLLENLNHKYAKLVLNFPPFTTIVSDNTKLKSHIVLLQQEILYKTQQIYKLNSMPLLRSIQSQHSETEVQNLTIKVISQDQMLQEYEGIISQLQQDFKKHLSGLKAAYENNNRDDNTFAIVKMQGETEPFRDRMVSHQLNGQRSAPSQIERYRQQTEALSSQNRKLSIRNKYLQQTISNGQHSEHSLQQLIKKVTDIKESLQKEQHEAAREGHVFHDNGENVDRWKQIGPEDRNRGCTEVKNYTLRASDLNKHIKMESQNRSLRKQLKQQDDKRILLQKQISKMTSKVIELSRESSQAKDRQLCLYQQLANTNQKLKAIEVREKVQTERSKQLNIDLSKFKKELQSYNQKTRHLRSQFNSSEADILLKVREGTQEERLSLRKGSFFGVTSLGKSCKVLDCQRSLNTTSINSCEKLSVNEPPRLSSTKRLMSKEVKKEVKPFLMKSKEIKNSIVLKG